MMNVCIDTVKTGENIKKYRIERKIPLFKIQNELGLGTVQAIYKWERGDCLPKLDNFIALCFLLGVSPMDICVFVDDKYSTAVRHFFQSVVMEELNEPQELICDNGEIYCPNCGCPQSSIEDKCGGCGQAVYYPQMSNVDALEKKDFERNYNYYMNED